MKICLFIEYDGTNYCGWQIQKNGVSVQQKIKEAVYNITRQECEIHGSGRTDAGVHAYKQVAHFKTDAQIPAEKYLLALNTYLPKDIRIKEAFLAGEDFHARFSAKKKHYRYVICNSPSASAVFANFSMHIPAPLDIYAMKHCGGLLVGKHDFKGFCCTTQSIPKDTVRTIYSLEVERYGEFIHIDVVGNGFLHNMVRIIAGSLIYAGQNKLTAKDFTAILKNKDRTQSGITAQPQGLFLVDVEYEEEKLI